MDVDVRDVPEQNHYEATVDGAHAGLAAYHRTKRVIVFTHTEVDPAFEGRGVGGALARTALDQARADGLEVLPVCPFFKAWIDKHPDYADLVHHVPASRVTD
ncbi:N-acetyltransferase [Solihabitans fulvus]|uniref:N-acetyltransferase n=1 Tax=Solihabitans fulvus TaxID=1892852 RepID=A0A5B2XST8_9PSEU|nr:GNAT family N-acetyltransferase [Solihabitans fulvus]KAA2266978.1 N-acetyltransferase [Solihabitans fulvus]